MGTAAQKDVAPADLAILGVGLTTENLLRLRRLLPSNVGVWIAEYTRDAYVSAALLADAPVPVVGTAVAQAFPRSPLTTAYAALDLDELSRGRFVLGLGSQVARANERWHGIKTDRPVERLTDYIHAVRAAFEALRGGEPSYEGDFYQFNLRGRVRSPGFSRTPPIYIAAVQRRMARAAGAIADGAIGHMLATPDFLREELVPAIRTGSKEAGRADLPFEVLLYRCCVLADAAPEAERDARRQIGFYAATKTYLPALSAMGFGPQAERAQRALDQGRPDDLLKAVDDSMLEAFAIVGDQESCTKELRRLSSEVDRLLLFPPYLSVPSDRLMAYHETVLEIAAAHNRNPGQGINTNDNPP